MLAKNRLPVPESARNAAAARFRSERVRMFPLSAQQTAQSAHSADANNLSSRFFLPFQWGAGGGGGRETSKGRRKKVGGLGTSAAAGVYFLECIEISEKSLVTALVHNSLYLHTSLSSSPSSSRSPSSPSCCRSRPSSSTATRPTHL